MTKCEGCGITLQFTDQNKEGYAVRKDMVLCQRCFRLAHYGSPIDAFEQQTLDALLSAYPPVACTLLWVVDLVDLESQQINQIAKAICAYQVIVIGNKTDLLPVEVSVKRLRELLSVRLRKNGLSPLAFYMISAKEPESLGELQQCLVNLKVPGVLLGQANAGKSSLIKALNLSKQVSVSRYPGTTAKALTFQKEGYTLVDLPGLKDVQSFIWQLDNKDRETCSFNKPIKARIYQIYSPQCFFIGGLVRLEVAGAGSVLFFFGEQLKLHRTKKSNGDALWRRQRGKLLLPVIKDRDPVDQKIPNGKSQCVIVIKGLGWIRLAGKAVLTRLALPEGIGYTIVEEYGKTC
ncbi:MAG: 50S ribosome-binding GTPase [Erysipelotrichaceae bacterium]|jgi:ribosome biogenesis GTPase A|nr:50S ribosome-binding GTPase [Erysipelotrichaceae bacterium]